MALAHSPKIVTDGLVFYYDMNNGQKSWKGAPTTNLLPNPDWSSGTDNNFTSWIRSDTVNINAVRDTYLGKNCIKLTRAAVDTGYDGIRAPLVTQLSANTTYTETITYAVPYSMTQDLRFYLPEYNSGGTVIKWNHYLTARNATAGWQTFTYTFTTDSLATSWGNYAIDWNTLASTQLETVYIEKIQLEQTSFATPFVNGSRSNTQALLDIKKSTTITANNLTYNSDGSFSFNGTSGYISTTNFNPLVLYPEFTVNIWFSPSDPGNGFQILAGQQGAGDSTSYAFQNFPTTSRMQLRWNNLSSGGIPGTEMVSNGIYNLCFVYKYTSSRIILYWNSTSVYSANYGILTNSNNFEIGRLANSIQYYKGKIFSISVYSRALSTIEILNNFNAHKLRYGL